MMACSIAPGKVILLGEHFVVKGVPAIGAAVTLYARVCVSSGQGRVESRQLGLLLDLSSNTVNDKGLYRVVEELAGRFGLKRDFHATIDSEIPISSGMGSSAAVAVSTTHALLSFAGVEPDKKVVWEVSFEAEKVYHVRPSGVDNTLSTYGGVMVYERGVFNRVKRRWPDDVVIVIADSGIKRSTGSVVADVLNRYDKYSNVMSRIYEAASELVRDALKSIETGDFARLGELMDINHGLLSSIGVSSRVLESIVWAMREAGALGAKISGAGRGGIVIGLVETSKVPSVVEKIKLLGLTPLVVQIDDEGVRRAPDSRTSQG